MNDWNIDTELAKVGLLYRKRHARASPSAACDVARRWPPYALATDRECIAETGVSQNRFGDRSRGDEWIQVYKLIKEHEPENLKTEVTGPQQKAQEALTSRNRLTSARFDQINSRDLKDAHICLP
jgi:hypothetical protein